MPEDLEVGVRFDTDQAVNDLEQDLEDAELTAGTDLTGAGGGTGGGGDGVGTEAAFAGAELGADAASPKQGITGLIGGIGKIGGALIAIAGLLVLLEPIQETLGLILRQFELFVVPFIAALTPLIEVVQKTVAQLIQIFRNPTDFIRGLVNGLLQAIQPFVNAVINALNIIPGLNFNPVSLGGDGQARTATGQPAASTGSTITSAGEQAVADGGGIAGLSALSPAAGAAAAAGSLGPFGFSRNVLLSDGARVEKFVKMVANRVEEIT